MKRWRMVAVLLLCLVLAGSIACNPFGGEQEPGSRLAEVVRGDLMVSVSGSGSIEVVNEVKLAFGTGGKIDKIFVKENDEVTKGKTLARLETDDLELALTQAELALTQAEVAQAQAEVAQSQAEVAQDQAEVAQSQAGITKTQAEIALETAKFELDRMKDVQEIKDDIEDAEWEVIIAETRLKEASQSQSAEGDIGYWVGAVAAAQIKVLELKQDLADLLAEDEYASLIVDEVKIKALQVKSAEQTVEKTRQSVKQAGRNVEQAERNVEYAKKSLGYTGQSVEFAKQNAEHARKQLDEAVIVAPFDGLIASVDAKEGDIIPPPTLAAQAIIHLIDTTNLELKIDVDEVDIPSVRLNQKAIIDVDALPDANFEGKVTAISPLPTSQDGVVLYEVEVGFEMPPGSELKVGMSATADIILNERNNALLVPNRAIGRDSQGNQVVQVMVGEQIEERAVITGMDDGFVTEIVSGLDEGDTVIVEAKAK